ncbi:Zinc metalloproteinase nas-6 [Orchesella cincta]|uniref:Metalloendopeptidase n=1 Tax=Orchesella cincta TaxID=48709 RepID=A0A1D2MHK8_ORCCI|nr:Zinc metalloproteinase nas-6 [Orchesella cincta]
MHWISGEHPIQQARSEESNQAYPNIRKIELKWPDGVVLYKYNRILTLGDVYEIHKAFDEYHKKTCIRFEKALESDVDFVSLEVNNDQCGVATVCNMGNGSYQFARFGQNCRNVSTMVHELAHTLCLGHENQRRDRDNYISYADCGDNFPRKLSQKNFRASGIYDYASQMHYQCTSCQLGGFPLESGWCGVDLTPGLSVLDADLINALYDCKGCHRHRWIPAVQLTDQDKRNMHSLALKSGDPALNVCRASNNGEVSAGKYDAVQKTCSIRFGTELLEVKENVEVLTIPGGLDADCSNYRWVNRVDVPVGSAVAAGNSFRSYNFTMFVAYGSITKNDGIIETSVGKVGLSQDDNGFTRPAELAVGSANNGVTLDYKVLACVVDNSCMIRQWFVERKRCS